jgi:hypothetical protein
MSNQGPQRVMFGTWLPTSRMRLGPLTLPGWGVLVVAMLAMVVSLTRGALGVGLLFVLGALLFELLFVVRFGGESTGRTIAQRVSAIASGAARAERGATQFNSGLFSMLPSDGLTSLPGHLGNLREIDGEDGFGRPFTLLHDPVKKTLTAVLACNPDGTDMQTQNTVDAAVAHYGGWIRSLSSDPALAGSTVVVDSSLRDKGPLVERIVSDLDPDAPDIARRHVFEAGDQLPRQYSEVSTWVTMTWLIESLAISTEDAVAEVAAKLSFQVDALHSAGGGSVSVATSRVLAEAVRVAYNPERSAEFASDALRGQTSGLRVTEAGPDFFNDERRRVCFHDGVASMTALILEPPKLHINESTLAPLFGPAPRFLRKRVALFYRPVAPDKAVQMVQRLGGKVSTVASSKARETAEDRSLVTKAKKLEQEVTDGASVTRFSMAVTVTFEADERPYREAELALKQLLGQSALSYRFCDFDTAAAFHSTLPLGILPWMYETPTEHVMGLVS